MEQKTLNYGIVIPSTHEDSTLTIYNNASGIYFGIKDQETCKELGIVIPTESLEEVSNYIKNVLTVKRLSTRKNNKPYDRHQAHHRLDSRGKEKA